MDVTIRKHGFLQLFDSLPSTEKDNYQIKVVLASMLEHAAIQESCKQTLLYSSIPVWTYSTGTVLFETDRVDLHELEYLHSYLDLINNCSSHVKYLKLSDISLESLCSMSNSELMQRFTQSPENTATSYSSWESKYIDQIEKSKKILQEQSHVDSEAKFIQCKKCKSNSVDTEQKQTRSADEPMTLFCYCRKCELRWTMA